MGRLVLTRRVDETIVINGNIRVTFLGYRGGQARIGIDAPPEIIVDREEVAQRKNAESRSGSGRLPAGCPGCVACPHEDDYGHT